MVFNFIAHSFTAIGTIFAPLITTEFIMPTIFHPYKYGGIPFKPPSFLKYTTIYVGIILLIIEIGRAHV